VLAAEIVVNTEEWRVSARQAGRKVRLLQCECARCVCVCVCVVCAVCGSSIFFA